MSHPAALPRTTVISAAMSKIMNLNVGYLKTVPGALRICQVVSGVICVPVIFHSCPDLKYRLNSGPVCSEVETYFFFIAYGCLLTTLLLLVQCLSVPATVSTVSKTLFELVYHVVCSILYFTSSLSLLITVADRNARLRVLQEPLFGSKIAASVLGLLNSGLYCAITYFSYRAYKEV